MYVSIIQVVSKIEEQLISVNNIIYLNTSIKMIVYKIKLCFSRNGYTFKNLCWKVKVPLNTIQSEAYEKAHNIVIHEYMIQFGITKHGHVHRHIKLSQNKKSTTYIKSKF